MNLRRMRIDNMRTSGVKNNAAVARASFCAADITRHTAIHQQLHMQWLIQTLLLPSRNNSHLVNLVFWNYPGWARMITRASADNCCRFLASQMYFQSTKQQHQTLKKTQHTNSNQATLILDLFHLFDKQTEFSSKQQKWQAKTCFFDH